MHGTEMSGPRRFLNGQSAGQSRLRLEADQMIFRQGDLADALYFIESGWIKLSMVSPGGKEAVVAIIGASEFFGTRSLLDDHRRMGTVITLTRCTFIRIATATVIRMIREEPDFAQTFTAELVRQAIRREESLTDCLINPSERRLAHVLLQLMGDSGDDKNDGIWQPITTPVTQAVLANMIGTTRSRVSFFMNRFRRRGFIEYDRHGHVTVCNSRLKGFLAA